MKNIYLSTEVACGLFIGRFFRTGKRVAKRQPEVDAQILTKLYTGHNNAVFGIPTFSEKGW